MATIIRQIPVHDGWDVDCTLSTGELHRFHFMQEPDPAATQSMIDELERVLIELTTPVEITVEAEDGEVIS